MGFLSNLLGMTGPGRLCAALNALSAKHLLAQMEEHYQQYMHQQITEQLAIGSGHTHDYAEAWVERLEPTAYYGMAAQIFLRMELPPPFPKCFAGGRWNIIDNPLIGLHDGDDEIRMARVEIFKRYQVDVELKKVEFKPPHKITTHADAITTAQEQLFLWVYSIFKPIEPHIQRPLRYEYMVAFSSMLATQCYRFALKGIQNKEPNTDSVIEFLQNIAIHLEDSYNLQDHGNFLQNTILEYSNLFDQGIRRQDMFDLCEQFTYHTTLIDGLFGQIENLQRTIKEQCGITTQSISGSL